MHKGNLVKFDEKEVLSGKASVGVEVNSVLADIELHLADTKYDAAETLRRIQVDLMVAAGRLVRKDESDSDGGEA